MRPCLNVSTLLLALSCVSGVLGKHPALAARQNNQDATVTSTSSNSASTSAPSSTTVSQRSSTFTTSQPLQTDDLVTSFATQSSSATASGAIATTALSDGTTTSTTTALPTTQADELPLHPRITPALGLAGVILIFAGVALTLIGIKHKWIHIFISTAILTGLAVTVLVIYVMNPPVSDAIQGAYLVAVVVTGLIFGAVSLIFKDVTEGLGCLLGGFCLAMWFLVLRPGGLIQSTAGSAIFIACLALAGFGLSFSRHTRNYGLIACTSFAGATATIVGIDCFSRAGLKEFWLYLWSLNNDAFPLGTTTYPITRGIRVEIAGIAIICLFGVLSQLKIWKIVKERRARQEAEQAQQDESKNKLESARGKSIETDKERNLAQWEAVYGDKNGRNAPHVAADSGVGSSIASEDKISSVRERELDEIKLSDIPRSKRESKISIRQSISKRFSSLEAGPKSPSWAAPSQEHLVEGDQAQASDRNSGSQISSTSRERYQTTEQGPAIVPLPFTLPEQHDDDKDVDSDDGSVSVAQSIHDRRGMPLSRLSSTKDRNSHRISIPHIDEERTYSLAATADGAPDVDLLSNPRWSMYPKSSPSPNKQSFDKNALFPGSNHSLDPRRLSRQTIGEVPVEEYDDEALVRPAAVPDNIPKMPSKLSDEPQEEHKIIDGDHVDDAASVIGSLHQHHLPQGLFKVAQTYRTNEWAKHIADAEQPEADDGLESTSPGIHVDPVFAKEAAKPVSADILSTNPVNNQQVGRTASHSSTNPYRNSVQRPDLTRTPSGTTATPVYAFERSTSQAEVSRQNSSAALGRMSSVPALRGPPTPTTVQERVESPLTGDRSTVTASRNLSTPLSMASAVNLMDEREDRLKRRPTTTSFAALAPAPNLHFTTPSDTASMANALSESPIDTTDEDMTLAVRKAMIQQQQQQRPLSPQQQQPARSISKTRSSSQTRPGSTSQPTGAQRDSRNPRRTSNPQQPSSRRNSSSRPTSRRVSSSQSLTPASQNLIYDSHQPKRTNTVDSERQSMLLSQWRQSLEHTNKPQPFTMQQGPSAQVGAGLTEVQRQVDARREFLEREREKREQKREEAMRHGAMHEAHRDKLRKMQAQMTDRGNM